MKILVPILTAAIPVTAVLAFSSFKAADSATVTPQQAFQNQQTPTTAKALKIIEDWRGESPEKGRRSLKVVYWSPSDRTPQPEYKQRLSDILLDIQKYYAKEMDRNRIGKLTMKFDKDKNGLVEIIEVKGKNPYSNYQVNSGNTILKDTRAELAKRGINADKETIVIFCNMSNWDEKAKTINQNSPYYARGNSNNGVAWQVDSAILKLDDLTNMKDRVRDGQYGNITLGKYNTIFIGGVAHELGHAFGLPHNLQRKDESVLGIALMGAGNRAYGNELRKDGPPAFLTQAHALKLSSHPMFSGITKEMHTEVKYEAKGLKYAVNNNDLHIKGSITSNIPCYAVVAYVDPTGGGDYDATTQVAVPEADGSFTIHCKADTFERRSRKGDVRLVYYFANGKATANQSPSRRDKVPYFINKEGKLVIGREKK